MRNPILGAGLADIRQKRTVLSSVAIVAIVVGYALLSAVPQQTSPASPISTPARQDRASQGVPGDPPDITSIDTAGAADTDEYSIKDYSEFDAEPIAEFPSSDWLGLLVELALKLGLVIGLIYLTIRLLKRYVYRDRLPVSALKPVSHLGSLSLAPQGSVHLIEVGRKLLVVGATPTQMSLLSEITDPEEISEVRAQCVENPGVDQFFALVNAARRRFGDREEAEGVKSPSEKD